MNPHWPARCPPTEFLPADAIRRWSAEGGHPIQDLTTEDDLTPLSSWAPGAKTIADDGLVAEERARHRCYWNQLTYAAHQQMIARVIQTNIRAFEAIGTITCLHRSMHRPSTYELNDIAEPMPTDAKDLTHPHRLTPLLGGAMSWLSCARRLIKRRIPARSFSRVALSAVKILPLAEGNSSRMA